jgi:3-dehydroquinate synthase
VAEATRIQLKAGSSSYSVLVGRGALQQLPSLLEEAGLHGRLRIVADERVARLYRTLLLACVTQIGRSAGLLEVSGRERDKNLATVSRVYDWLIEVGTDRSDAILALGGGVVGDLVGFAAATYLRGLRLVQLPTTLLAMVDSSIGGKTGVDHPAGKNLIGAFHQPSLVVADLDFLVSLPRRELSAGWVEVIKMGVARSPALFSSLEAAPEQMLVLGPEAAPAIVRSIELKGEVVAADERETLSTNPDLVQSSPGEHTSRMVLNYGHTIGHAIEVAGGYGRFLHGEAVAIGMVGAAEIARCLGLLDRDAQARQSALLERFGLPTRCPSLSPDELWGPLLRDKKAVGDRLRWVLPSTIGRVEIVDSVPDSLVRQTLTWLVQD